MFSYYKLLELVLYFCLGTMPYTNDIVITADKNLGRIGEDLALHSIVCHIEFSELLPDSRYTILLLTFLD